MLQLFDNKYPYTDLHELNLNWIISRIIEMDHKLTNFVSLNTIKYADPIGWDITKQYETNTVVMDSSTGIAYISSQPVPAGVSIGDTDYWSVIFDLQEIIGNINQNLTIHNNGASPTLLFSVNEGDWILWNSKLYKALADLLAGTALIEDVNVKAETVEELTKEYTDALYVYIGLLSDLQTTDKSSIVNAINEILTNFRAMIGNLNDLSTTDKSSIVDAINEVYALPKGVIINVKDHGAVGDGVTNDYAAILDAISTAGTKGLSVIYFPDGEYFCGNGTFTLDSSHIEFMGAANSKLISSGLSSSDSFITIVSTFSLGQYDYPRKPISKLCLQGNYFNDTGANGTIGIKMGTDTTYMAPHTILENVVVRNFAIGLELSSAYKTTYLNCSFMANNRGVVIPSAGVQQAVPCTFVSCWFEANDYAIIGLAGGYNNITFLGGAFEYNRSVISAYTKVVFVGVRFEYDAHASCDTALNIRPVFAGSTLASSHTVQKYIGCYFLELNNFESNVAYWIPNPYKATAYNTSRFYCVGGGKVSLECSMCEFESANDIPAGAGYYYISTDKYYGYGNYTNSITVANMVDPNYVVQSGNGFII